MGTGAAILCIALAVIVVELSLSSAESCENELLTPSSSNDGYITSPGYPEQYSANICKIWTYYGRPGMQINISFLDVDIPNYSDACDGDKLKIGQFAEHIYCGSIYSKNFEPYTTQLVEPYALRIVFISKSYGNRGRGFKIYYRFIEKSLTDSTESESYIDATVPGENSVYQKDFGQCNFVLTNNSGEIRSEYLFSAIQKSGFCTWLLQSLSVEGQKATFELTIEIFQLSSDSIFNVYDGANMSAEVLGTQLSLTHYTSLTSSQSSLFIYYNPGNNFRSVGLSEIFKIRYYKVVTCIGDYLPCGFNEPDCFRRNSRCDGIWNCPLHGGDERGCSDECPTDFRCGARGMGCYIESERCNGKGICPNNIDEQKCDEEHCSSSKGLFLCSNLRCVFENLRCDRKNDCIDNSDEDDCYSSLSTRVILAAVVCTLVCALVLVIATGCACKLYRRRVRRLHGIPRHESPLSRQLSEMLHHRAPPPPYHEAMLTSRPYSEAYLELLSQTDDHQSESSGTLNNGYQENDDQNPPRQQFRNNTLQSNRNSLDNLLLGSFSENQNPSSHHRTESGRLIEVNTLPLSSERVESDIHQAPVADIDDSPSYNNTLLMTEVYPESVVSTDNNVFLANHDRQSLIQIDMMPSNHDQASTFLIPPLISLNEVRSAPSRPFNGCNDENDSDKDTISASTSLSFDYSRLELEDGMKEKEEDDKIQEDVDIIDEDSDSDCILAGNETYDNDDDDSNDSDAACVLDQV